MKSVSKEYNKVYIGNQEITQGSLYNGDIEVGVLHEHSGLFRKLGEYEVGDIALWDKTREMIKVAPVEIIKNINKDNFTPIGIVVIPSSHNVWGDGKAGIMSLKYMSCDTPETGSLLYEYTICWGLYKVDTELKNFNKVVTIDNGVQDCGYIDNTYEKPTSDIIPSPINEDGSRNPAYYDTSLTDANACSDFDGIGNTNVLINLATAQADWRTAASIDNECGVGYSPAACCCWRYHTEGTNPGDWYLPACGELGYAMAKRTEINKVIEDLNSVYGSIAMSLDDFPHLSSSEYDTYSVCTVDFYDGCVNEYEKYIGDTYIYAFLRVK